MRKTNVGGSSVTRFLYDGAEMIAEYGVNASGASVLLRRHVFGPGVDEPLVWYESAGTTDRRYLVADQLGSIVAVTNASGAANGSGFGVNTYDEYGAPGPSNTGRFGFTGQAWLPEAQLYHFKARAYVPALGRFGAGKRREKKRPLSMTWNIATRPAPSESNMGSACRYWGRESTRE